MPKIVYDRCECGLTNEEDEKLVELSDAWSVLVPVTAFPEDMKNAIIERLEEDHDDFSIDVMGF